MNPAVIPSFFHVIAAHTALLTLSIMITVEQLDEQTYQVTVAGKTTTTHEVIVDPEYGRKLAADAPVERLIRASFGFLLAREPNTAILSRFDLRVIGRYFPEYEQEITGHL